MGGQTVLGMGGGHRLKLVSEEGVQGDGVPCNFLKIKKRLCPQSMTACVYATNIENLQLYRWLVSIQAVLT